MIYLLVILNRIYNFKYFNLLTDRMNINYKTYHA